jgi:hypothetical protein
MDTIDTKENIELQIAEIKARMPETYNAILAKAAEIGNSAFSLVRRGLRGEPNCFYAMENGHVKGAPFNQGDIMPEIARYMVQFGCTFIVVWQSERGGGGGSWQELSGSSTGLKIGRSGKIAKAVAAWALRRRQRS